MKYILFLIPVVLVSLCTQLPDLLPELPFLQAQKIVTSDMGNSDIFIKAETSSSQIKAGRSVQVIFELRNKQLYDLKNVYFEVYDHPCFPNNLNSGLFTKNDCGEDGTLRTNQTCIWNWRWTSETSDIDRQCTIRFKTSYELTNSIFQDIVVLPEPEYLQKEVEGTLKDIPIHHSSAKGPLDISFSFSEPQPFMESQTGYNMYINYYNKEQGFIKDLNIRITIPNNIDLTCEGYTKTGNKLVLNKELKFIKGRAVPTICNFTTFPTSTISIRSLSLTANYKYVLYNSIPIMVKA